MGLPATQSRRVTFDDYVRLNEESAEKLEYHNGEVLSMAGGSPTHSLLCVNIGGELRSRLRGSPCRPYDSNLRIGQGSGYYVYPDLSIVCGPLVLDPFDRTNQTVTNPRVVVEVLSPSTERYDRSEKFRRYLQIETLQEYVLIHQSAPIVEVYTRQEDGAFAIRIVEGLASVAHFRSLKIELPLSELYAGVEFPPAEEPPSTPTNEI